nr:MAG: porin [Leptolyngbya sp. IPPAS B-1204]
MNPPLHDVALHQRKNSRLYAQCWSRLSATTLIALGVCAGWQPHAEANSERSTQIVQPLITVQDEVEEISVVELSDELNHDDLQFSPASELIDSDIPLNASIAESEDAELAKVDILKVSALDVLFVNRQNYELTAEVNESPNGSPQESSNQVLTVSQGVSELTPELNSESIAQSANDVDRSNADRRNELLTPASRRSQDLGEPLVQVQGVYTLQGEESSARGRVSASYAISPNLLVGGTIDVTGGDAFSDSPETGFDLNELYVAVSPTEVPNLRFIVGMLDLTSYFDRNSFAKDAATQFLNPVFQSNPALAAAGLGSRPAILLNWSVADPLEIKIAGFSSDRDLADFALDGFAGEIGLRFQNLILRGTYITGRDAGQDSGFQEIFQIARGDQFGLRSGDREAAYGLNAEYFIPEINLGLFARYGWYENLELDRGGTTYSVGVNLLDLFMPYDRLGLAYGQQLSNADLRRDRGDDYPDVWELFYDFRITPNLRAGVTVQSFDQFSETIGGFRIRADFDSSDFGRLFR